MQKTYHLWDTSLSHYFTTLYIYTVGFFSLSGTQQMSGLRKAVGIWQGLLPSRY